MGDEEDMDKGTGGKTYSNISVNNSTGVAIGDNNTITVTQNITGIPEVFANSLEEFAEKVNVEFKRHEVPEPAVRDVERSVEELADEVKDVDPEKEEELGYARKAVVEGKLATIIDKTLNALPDTVEVIASFTPLAPFGKLIGKGIDKLVSAIRKE